MSPNSHYKTFTTCLIFPSNLMWKSTYLFGELCLQVQLVTLNLFWRSKVHVRFLSQIWRVGIKWEDDMKRENIKKVVRTIMVNEKGKETRQRTLDLKNWFKLCSRKRGSSHNSLDRLVNYILSLWLNKIINTLNVLWKKNGSRK